MAVVVCVGGSIDDDGGLCLVVLSPPGTDADGELVPRARWVVQ